MADISTFSDADFAQWVQAVKGSGNQAEPGLPQPAAQGPPQDDLSNLSLLPNTRQALEAAVAQTNAQLDPTALTEASRKIGLRPGVPFNLERGAPSKVRAALSFDSDTLNQFKLLSKVYGAENVDVSGDGRFVVRNQADPATGIREDFHVNPIGGDAGDIAGMAADVLPILAGAVGAKVGGLKGSRPLAKFAGGLLGGAAGAESTTAAEQTLSRLLQGNPLNPGSLALERSKAAVLDMAIGGTLAGGSKFTTKAAQGALGLLGIETGSTATTRAAKDLTSRTGVKYPLTPGEAAESPLLIRMEATAKPRIGSVGIMGEIEAGKAKAEDELRRVFLGLPRSMSDDEVAAALPKTDATGQKILSRLGTEDLRLKGEVSKAREVVEQTGTAEAQKAAAVNLAAPLEPTAVGQALRTKTVSDFDSFKAQMAQRYAAFESNPLVSARVVLGDKLSKAGAEVEKELFPQAARTKEVPTGILDASGNPLTTKKTSTEALDSFVSASARRAVDELKGLAGAKVGISDMKRIRTAIDNSIAEGVAIPGTDVKQLVTLREKVTDAIRSSLSDLDPALLKQWDQLGTDYAKGIQRFDRIGVRQMLVKEGEKGSVGNAQLARSVASGEPGALDRYNDFKEFFGAASPEFKAIQQTARESVLKGALSETSGYVTGADLRSRLRALDPEVATDLFGTSKQELHRIGEALSVAQGNLDLEDLQKLASSRTLTAAAIPNLIAAEKARATAWGNKLIRAAAKGSDIGEEVVKPSTVVRSLSQMDPDQARSVLGILSDRPELLEDVRQLAVEDLWSRVQAELKGRTGVTSGLIQSALGSETQRRTWRLLLGNDVVDTLKVLSDVVKPQELGAKAFKSAGSLGATEDIARLERGGAVGVLTSAAERMLIAVLYTGPLKQAIVNLATPVNQGRLLNSIIASGPFIERVAERFGSDAPGVMESLRSVVEPRQARELQVQGVVKDQGTLDLGTLSPAEFNMWMQRQKQ